MEDDMTVARRRIAAFKKLYPESLQTISCLDRLLNSNTLEPADLKKAVFYLTDEDYVNERHAILFFANKLC